MTQLAIYPGSFDPITLGHLSVLRRASVVFERVELVIVHNPSKIPTFSLEERFLLAQESIAELPGVTNVSISTLEDGLLAKHAVQLGAKAIIKGFRTASDVEYELPMSQVNRDLSGIETVFFAAEAGFGFVSSSLVRQVNSLGGDISGYVTKSVARAFEKKAQS